MKDIVIPAEEALGYAIALREMFVEQGLMQLQPEHPLRRLEAKLASVADLMKSFRDIKDEISG